MNRKILVIGVVFGLVVSSVSSIAQASGSYVANPFKKKKVADAASAEAAPSPSPSPTPTAAAPSGPKGQAFKRK